MVTTTFVPMTSARTTQRRAYQKNWVPGRYVEYGAKNLTKRQKQAVTEVIATFNLLRYSITKGKQTGIHAPDELFAEWITEYRSSATQLDDMAV